MKLYYYIILAFSIIASACSTDLDSELLKNTPQEETEQTRAINTKTCSKCRIQYNADIYTSCPNGCQDENVYGYHCSICKKPVSGKNGSCNNCGDNPNRKNVPCTSLTCICKQGSGSSSSSHDDYKRVLWYYILPDTGNYSGLWKAWKETMQAKSWNIHPWNGRYVNDAYEYWDPSYRGLIATVLGEYYDDTLLVFQGFLIWGYYKDAGEFMTCFISKVKENNADIYVAMEGAY